MWSALGLLPCSCHCGEVGPNPTVQRSDSAGVDTTCGTDWDRSLWGDWRQLPVRCLLAFDYVFWPVGEHIFCMLICPMRGLPGVNSCAVVPNPWPTVHGLLWLPSSIILGSWQDQPHVNHTDEISCSIFQIKQHSASLLGTGVRLMVDSSCVVPGSPSRVWNFPRFQNFLNTDICYWDRALADFSKALQCKAFCLWIWKCFILTDAASCSP